MHVILRFDVSPERPAVAQRVCRYVGVACLDYVTPVRETLQLLTNHRANALKTIFLADQGNLSSDGLGNLTNPDSKTANICCASPTGRPAIASGITGSDAVAGLNILRWFRLMWPMVA